MVKIKIKTIFYWIGEISLGTLETIYKISKVLMVMAILGWYFNLVGYGNLGYILILVAAGGFIFEFKIIDIIRISKLKR